jgi:hypothetical protein
VKKFRTIFRLSGETTTGVTLKLHMKEHHVALYMKKHGSIGRFGEDPIESLHPILTEIYNQHGSIRNPVDRIKSVAAKLLMRQLAQPLLVKKRNQSLKLN